MSGDAKYLSRALKFRQSAIFVLLVAWLIATSPACSIGAESTSDVSIERMRCEYLSDPLGLDVAQPRLDWLLIGKGKMARNITQKSYHILVASTPTLLAADTGDLWDSAEVASSDTAFIAYAGAPLKSRQSAYWKVRITDSRGQVSAWSKPAFWEMGFLEPGDWQAKWIDVPPIREFDAVHGPVTIISASYEANDGSGSKDVTAIVGEAVRSKADVQIGNGPFGGDPAPNHSKQIRVKYSMDGKEHEMTESENEPIIVPEGIRSLPYLRKDFAVGKQVSKARIFVTALGLYELRINGQRIGDHVFAPEWTEYGKRVCYQVYDVTALLKPGANTLAGLVGDGWFCGHIGLGGFKRWGNSPALLAQLEVTYADGTTERIVTDSTWKARGSPVLTSDFMRGENYDAQKEIDGWDRPGLDLSHWSPVSERVETRRLEAQIAQPVRKTGERQPKSVTEPKPGQWTFDLGQNMVGFVRIRVSAPAGTMLTVRHGEILNPDGTLYTANLRGAPSTDTYTCKGSPDETWEPRFTFHGFRYVEVTGLPKAPPLDAITGIIVGTDIPHTGDFICSNQDVNQLQSNIQWGMRGNYLSVPTDCPQRDERYGWLGDAEVFVRTAAYNGDIAAFFTKWTIDVDDCQGADGNFSNVSPGALGNGASAWADAGVICPWTIYLMYGDKRILEKHLPAMTRFIEWCRARYPNFIRGDKGTDYGDWLAQGESTPLEIVGTCYFAYCTSLVARSYRAIGDNVNADKYQKLFDDIKAAFNQQLVTADGHVRGETQCGYALAIRFNLLSDDLRIKAAHYLDDDIKAHKDHLTTGFIGVSHLLPALTMGNEAATAYDLLLQDTFPSWLFSVKHGATTIWERWDGWTPEKGFQDPGMNSLNHYSLGSCGEWMFDAVAGIGVDTERPGFKHFLIHPHLGGSLAYAEGTFDSICGRISSRWEVKSGQLALHVSVPINTTATIEIPTADFSSVQEGGRSLASFPEMKISPSGGSTVLVGSGDYHFTCTAP